MDITRATISQLTQIRGIYLITWDTEQYHISRSRAKTFCERDKKADWHTRTIWPQHARGLSLCPRCWKAFLAARSPQETTPANSYQIPLHAESSNNVV